MNKLILLTVFFLAIGCSNERNKGPKIAIGEVVTNEDKKWTEDGRYRISMTVLPPTATNITYIGNSWYTFELNDICFLFAARGRASVITTADVCSTT